MTVFSLTAVNFEAILYCKMARTFEPRIGIDLTKQDRNALSLWVNPAPEGAEEGFEFRFVGKRLEMARQVVAFLASDPKHIKKAVLGEPIEYHPLTKEEKA
jgi:hypothetical protein